MSAISRERRLRSAKSDAAAFRFPAPLMSSPSQLHCQRRVVQAPVIGSITEPISRMSVTGKPPAVACSRTASGLSAM